MASRQASREAISKLDKLRVRGLPKKTEVVEVDVAVAAEAAGPKKKTKKGKEPVITVTAIERKDQELVATLSNGEVKVMQRLVWVHHTDPKNHAKSIGKLDIAGVLYPDARKDKDVAAFVISETERYNKMEADHQARMATLKPVPTYTEEPTDEPQAAKVPKAKQEPKAPVEKDAFGCRKGSQAADINAALTKKGKTLEVIAKETGMPVGRVKGHLKAMVAKKFVAETKGKYAVA
jgi:hypothetical protein